MRAPTWILLALAGLGLAALLLSHGCDSPPPPRKPLHHDYGTIRHGQGKDHVFEIPLPEADEELIPVAFQGDCACAAGLVMIRDRHGHNRPVLGLEKPDARVLPGETVVLRLFLDTSTQEPVSIKSTPSHGTVTFESLRSTNPRRYHVPVTFDYAIHAPVRLAPVAIVDLGELPYCKTFSQTLELHNDLPGHQLELGELRIEDPRISAELTQQPGNGEGPLYLLKVTFRPDRRFPIGPFVSAVRVDTNIPNDKERGDYYQLPVQVSGTVIEDIQVLPNAMYFGLFDFKTKKERSVNVTDHDRTRPAGFVVDGIRNQNGVDVARHFEVRFQKIGERRTRVFLRYLGTLGGPAEGTVALRGELRGELSLGKNDGGPDVVRIPFVAHNSKR